MKSQVWARWRSIFYETITGSVFCEVPHSVAIRRKHDSTHQDVAFFGKHFVAFSRKKRWCRSRGLKRRKSANQKCSSYTHFFHHSALLSGQPKVNWASMPSGLLAQLTTKEYGPLPDLIRAGRIINNNATLVHSIWDEYQHLSLNHNVLFHTELQPCATSSWSIIRRLKQRSWSHSW